MKISSRFFLYATGAAALIATGVMGERTWQDYQASSADTDPAASYAKPRARMTYPELIKALQEDRIVSIRRNAGINIRYNVTAKRNDSNKISQDFSSDYLSPQAAAEVEALATDVAMRPGSNLKEFGKDPEVIPKERGLMGDILVVGIPMLMLIGVWAYMFNRMTRKNGPGGTNTMSKANAKLIEDQSDPVTFADVAGVDEAKEEVQDLVDFLANPEKYQKLGGKIPRGILMVGPPGTGKTLLARAIAGEARLKREKSASSNWPGAKKEEQESSPVPFYSISGSDFVEMFVGVGASRVRDLFTQAKKHAPCIIFIDEIDAVGRARNNGASGGNEEREQTLNQILVEMDGFSGSEGVIVIAATNRADVLDKALLRPGRFDTQVTVDLSDMKGREQILKVHAKHTPLAEDVDLSAIARGTPGFSGADLANLINAAALLAAKNDQSQIFMNDLEAAKDKILMGAERQMIMTKKQKEEIAYHEAGHTIVGCRTPEHDPVYKVSIMPRGKALGITMYLPEKDQFSVSKQKVISNITSLLAGRLGEILLHEKRGHENPEDFVQTGAENDIERATEFARNMATRWGMEEKLQLLNYAPDKNGYMVQSPYSQATQELIDEVMAERIQSSTESAERILRENLDILHNMGKALIEHETLNREQINRLMNGEDICEEKLASSNALVSQNSSFSKPSINL